MWYQPEIVTPVSAEPVTFGMAKQQCRAEIYDDDGNIAASRDDPLFQLLITSARDHVEKICGQFFAPCEVEAHCDGFADLARFDIAPVTEIVAINYVSVAGTAEILPASTYELRKDGLDASAVLKSGNAWPNKQAGSRIKVHMKVGTASPPPTVLRAMLLLIGAWYENREETVIGVSIGQLPTYVSVDALLCNNRRYL
ncbi:head-tail connector protein [Brucella anthropi]|uniref:head-tail connector protein n=1 Tax=Brucella anthropi TaxID=529 RepID=UPI00125D2D38|nr:head-tail connector protein [Brucella anthropi]QFP61893.1 phage gp6-like head-tail connector protein [Brucella anthropi]